MKKFALLALIFVSTLTSCSLDDGAESNFYLAVLPIDGVEMPESFVQGETYEIFVTYIKPNSCHTFNDFIYEIDGNERTVAVVNTVYYANNGVSCDEVSELVTVSFDLYVSGNETYIFKFFQGEDPNSGEDQYYLVEVPVMEGRTPTN
ncbi:hypothetical protein [uncultured Winogradskyella sp.]|uniref:hypothetical protein n=1 Tax=Winogradskyella sp. 4-2091 TaxID=3381659 RepID=UPI00261B35A0|nr:hypothetical protein [uncultured Winogradskyella sp.]